MTGIIIKNTLINYSLILSDMSYNDRLFKVTTQRLGIIPNAMLQRVARETHAVLSSQRRSHAISAYEKAKDNAAKIRRSMGF